VNFQLHAFSALTPRPWLLVPLNSRLDTPHCRSGQYNEETRLFPHLGILRKLPSRQAHGLITIPAELPRLWSENLRQPLIQIDKIPKFVMYEHVEALREEERKF
jgi:hypothetical protein